MMSSIRIRLRRLGTAFVALAISLWLLAPSGGLVLGAQAAHGALSGGTDRLVAAGSTYRIPDARPAAALKTAASLPAMPAGWPSTHLELGLADSPGGAAALHAKAAFGFRYQYLAGGVNTGNGWSTWNANGTFVSMYVAESAASHLTPVFPYYQLLYSNPSSGSSESARDLSNLANHTTMAAYYNDIRLFFTKAAGSTPVVLHVEPDLWGYIEQATGTGDNATTIPASVASSGDPALTGLPNTAAGFAQAIVKLRDLLAPNVILAYHLSVWGTNTDISISNSSDSAVDALAARAAAFYHSLGAHFDVTFTDVADRDASFKQIVYGDGGASRWDDADFVRYARFVAGYVAGAGQRVVVWQIPLGNTKMRAQDNTWGHYQDNRPEWFLDDPGGTHLALWRDAGVIGLFFGGGADGTTCACDGQNDGTTNPPAIDGNDRLSLNADDDGGYFHERAAAYYAAGALGLDPGSGGGTGGGGTGGGGGGGAVSAKWTLSASVSPTSLTRNHNVTVKANIKTSITGRAVVRVEVLDPSGHVAFHKTYSARTYKAGKTVAFKPVFHVSSTRKRGVYTIRIRTLSAADGHVLASRTSSRTFRVR